VLSSSTVPSIGKPGRETTDSSPPDPDSSFDVARLKGGVLPEEAVLSDVFALRPASVPEDVCEFAVALDSHGFERVVAEQRVGEVQESQPHDEGEEEDASPFASSEDGDNRAFLTPEPGGLLEIGRAIAQLSRLREDLLREAESQLVTLAGEIAERVVARELRVDASFVTSLVQEGVSALASGDCVTVRLGKAFASERDALVEQIAGIRTHTVVTVDHDLEPSGCVLETAFERVDESLSHRLDVVMQSLSIDGIDGDIRR
jgi:hypothetical protein